MILSYLKVLASMKVAISGGGRQKARLCLSLEGLVLFVITQNIRDVLSLVAVFCSVLLI